MQISPDESKGAFNIISGGTRCVVYPIISFTRFLSSNGDESRIIGSGIRIKLGIWRGNLGDRHLASSLVAGDPGELGELTLFATLTQTQTRAFGEFGLKLYTDTDTQHKCSRCSCKFKRIVFILIKVVCYTYLAATTTLFKRN